MSTNNKIIINSSETKISSVPTERKYSIENFSIVNLDYNDNKTIITLKGDGGEGEITTTTTTTNGNGLQPGKWINDDVTSNDTLKKGDKFHVNGDGNTNGHNYSVIDDISHEHNSDYHDNEISKQKVIANNKGKLDEEINEIDNDDFDEENNNDAFSLSDSEIEDILEENDMDNDNIEIMENPNDSSVSSSSDKSTFTANSNSLSISNDLDITDISIDKKSSATNDSTSISTSETTISHQNSSGSSFVYVSGDNISTEETNKMSYNSHNNNSSQNKECENIIGCKINEMYETINLVAKNQNYDKINNVTENNTKIEDKVDCGIVSRRNSNGPQHHHKHHHQFDDERASDEDEAFVEILGKANEIAEARLAARRQARAEAREIRMRELERQQKEQEQNADRVFDMQNSSGVDPLSRSRVAILSTPTTSSTPLSTNRGNSLSSRRSSEDSLEEEGRSLRDLRHELKDVEERFRKAMITNAQLDNERSSQAYQIQLLKDKLEEMEEAHSQLQREYKDKCRDHDALKRNNDKLTEELKLVQGQLNERDTLIDEHGLVIVIVEDENGKDAKRALVSAENAHMLESTQGSLDIRLKKFAEDKRQLESEVHQLQQQLNDAKTQGRRSGSANGPLGDDEYEDAQRESNKIIADYKYKLQKAEQEIASLQANLARSETQVIRYKSTAEAAEKAEAELKIERRKLQRENREATERLEELETSNNHLLKRLDKLKNAKSALLKDL